MRYDIVFFKGATKFLACVSIFLFLVVVLMIANAKGATNAGFKCQEELANCSAQYKTDNSDLYNQYLKMNDQYQQCAAEKEAMLKDVTTKQYNTLSQQSIDDIMAMLKKANTPVEQKCYIPGFGQMIVYCNGEKKYACGGKFVDNKTYQNCDCPLQNPECVVQ